MRVAAPVRLGVLGCADIAWRKILPAVLAEPNLRLVAVAGRDRVKTESFAGRFDCEAVLGYEELLERADIDAVYLPLPVGLRRDWVARALAAGKHVLTEKPLVTSEAEALEVIELAKAAKLTLMENIAFLLHGQHQAVRSLQRAGEIGELRLFSSSFGIPPLSAENIRYRPELGGGALLDVGFYPLRAAQWFLGPELRVRGAQLRLGESGVDVAGTVLIEAPDGAAAQLSFGLEHFYRNSYQLWGSTGRLSLDRAFTPPPTHQPVVRLQQQDQVELRSLPAEDHFGALVATFAAAVLDGVDLSGHHREVLTHLRLVDSIRLNAEPGEP